MNDKELKPLGILVGGKWDKMHDISRRVYDEEGICPTIPTAAGGNTEVKIAQKPRGKNKGGVRDTDIAPTVTANAFQENTFIVEEESPRIGALRGRNPDNPSDRTAGIPTVQMLEVRSDECTNAITTVQKDNVVIEPIIYDDYNGRIKSDQTAINSLTQNCGSSTPRNGVKILEPAEAITTRGNDIAGTIRSTIHKNGSRNIIENLNTGQGYEGVLVPEDAAGIYTGVSQAFQSGPLPDKSRAIKAEKFDAGVVIINGKRYVVRKLTPRECWRLFGFTDRQFDKAKEALNAKYYKGKDKSSSQLYKQAGNTIVIPMLEAVLLQLKGVELEW